MILFLHNSDIDNERIVLAKNLKNKKRCIFLYDHPVFLLSNTNILNYSLLKQG